MGTLFEDLCIFFIVLLWILLRMKNVSDRSCRENQNTHYVFNEVFWKLCLYEIKWKNMVEPDRPYMTI